MSIATFRSVWLCAAFALAIGLRISAATDPAASPLRWVFLVETSDATLAYKAPIASAIADRLRNGLNNLMRPGDVFTIWTFDQQVWTDRFLPTAWTPGAQETLAKGLLRAWEDQPFTGEARLELAVQEVTRLVARSDTATVILIGSGSQTLTGMHFDDHINAAYRQAQQAESPGSVFLTTFLAREGQIIGWSVEPLPVRSQPAAGHMDRVSAKGADWVPQPGPPQKRIAAPVRQPLLVTKELAAAPRFDPVVQTNDAPSKTNELRSELIRELQATAEPPIVLSPPPTEAAPELAATESEVLMAAAAATQPPDVEPEVAPVRSQPALIEPEPALAPSRAAGDPGPVSTTPPAEPQGRAAIPAVQAAPEAHADPADKEFPIASPALPREPSSSDSAKAPVQRVEAIAPLQPEPASKGAQPSLPPPRRGGNGARVFLLMGIALLSAAGWTLFAWSRRRRSARGSSFISQSLEIRR